MKIYWKALLISFIIVYATALIGSIFTAENTQGEWYQQIKPSITPPNFVFPIAWNILFFLIAVSLYLAWTSSKTPKERKVVAIVFAVNLILNMLWSLLFFTLQNPVLAFIEIIVMWLSIVMVMAFVWKINKTATWLLLPYLLWVSFATILNFLSAF